MNSMYYKLDDYHNAVPCEINEVVWDEKTRRVGNDVVKKTRLERFINFITFGKFSIGEYIRISTVFLVINHQYHCDGEPMIFETMVFGGKYDQEMERYSTWKQAEIGHKQWIEKIENGW